MCENVTADGLYFVITSLLIPCSLSTLFLNALLLVSVWKVKLLHRNVRTLITQITVTALCTGLLFSYRTIYNISLYMGTFKELELFSVAVREIFSTAVLSLRSCTSMCIIVERLRASLKIALVEKNTTGWTIKILLVLSCLMAIAVTTATLLNAGYQKITVCYSYSLFAPSLKFALPLVIGFLLLHIIVLIGYALLLRYNQTSLRRFALNTAQNGLLLRMQIWNNIKVTESFLPVILLHSLCFIPFYILLTIYYWFSPTPLCNIRNIDFLLLINYLPLIDSMLFPIACVWRTRHLKRSMLEWLQRTLHCVLPCLPPRIHAQVHYHRRSEQQVNRNSPFRTRAVTSISAIVPNCRSNIQHTGLDRTVFSFGIKLDES